MNHTLLMKFERGGARLWEPLQIRPS